MQLNFFQITLIRKANIKTKALIIIRKFVILNQHKYQQLPRIVQFLCSLVGIHCILYCFYCWVPMREKSKFSPVACNRILWLFIWLLICFFARLKKEKDQYSTLFIKGQFLYIVQLALQSSLFSSPVYKTIIG